MKNFDDPKTISVIIGKDKLRTWTLEDYLKFRFEKEINGLENEAKIIIEYTTITDCQKEVIEKYPTAKVIVGSDGAHSIVRKQMFGSKPTLLELDEIPEEEISMNEESLIKENEIPIKNELPIEEEVIIMENGISMNEITINEAPKNDIALNENIDPVEKQNLQYFAIIKYQVEGKTRPLSKWTEIPGLLLKSNHMYRWAR